MPTSRHSGQPVRLAAGCLISPHLRPWWPHGMVHAQRHGITHPQPWRQCCITATEAAPGCPLTMSPYTSSASRGWPAWAICTLIWCVRPVTGRQHTRQHPTPFTRAAGSTAAAGPQLLDTSWGQLVLTDSTCSHTVHGCHILQPTPIVHLWLIWTAEHTAFTKELTLRCTVAHSTDRPVRTCT